MIAVIAVVVIFIITGMAVLTLAEQEIILGQVEAERAQAFYLAEAGLAKMEETLEKHIELFRKGNQEAFGKVYDYMVGKIYKFIYFKTYHKETAEDLTSQTFMKALNKIHLFNNKKGKFSSWIYRIARNQVIDYYRTRRHTVDIQDIWDIAGSENVEIDIQNKHQMEEVRDYLQQLKPEQRDIVIMRVWQELSYKEISEILGKTESSCKMVFSRAISRLGEAVPLTAFLLLLMMKKFM